MTDLEKQISLLQLKLNNISANVAELKILLDRYAINQTDNPIVSSREK